MPNPIKDKNGKILEKWPECIVCGSALGYWKGDRYFCQHFNCPVHYVPQEWLYEVEDAEGNRGVVRLDKLEKAIEGGYKVVGGGVGAEPKWEVENAQ